MALRSISTQLKLDGKQNPLADAQGKHPQAIRQLLEGYRREDPPTQPKLAIPLAVITFLLSGSHNKNARGRAVANLDVIAFYYLLRVGEYTYHKKSDRR